jgi:hypothetical protein
VLGLRSERCLTLGAGHRRCRYEFSIPPLGGYGWVVDVESEGCIGLLIEELDPCEE